MLRWYQWEHKRHPIRPNLKEYSLCQFHPANGGTLYEQWLATTQTTTLLKYHRKFIEMATPLEWVVENILMGHFINGLKDELKAKVRLLNSVNLEQAMELVDRIEEKSRVLGIKRSGFNSFRSGTFLFLLKTYAPIWIAIQPIYCQKLGFEAQRVPIFKCYSKAFCKSCKSK